MKKSTNKIQATIASSTSKRKGWDEAFKKMAANGDDELLIPDVFKDEKLNDWWDDLSDEQKRHISEAEAELDAGKGVPHEEVMKKYKIN